MKQITGILVNSVGNRIIRLAEIAVEGKMEAKGLMQDEGEEEE